MQTDLFGTPLQPDPTVALRPPQQAVALRPGPLPKVQFVVELVGPRSMPASVASNILDSRWFAALGQPDAWCMRPADTVWRRLTPATDGSYDSLSLAWDLVSHQGRLTEASAQSLLARAEEFARHVQRRAMPMPMPDEVNRQVQALLGVQQDLDIGFAIAFGPTAHHVGEKDLWVQCSRLGLEFGSTGAFEWKSQDNPLPLLSVTPIGGTEAFSLAAVERGDVHEGATVGFSFPLCPSPTEAFDGCLHVGRVLCQSLGGALFDEEGAPLTATSEQRLRFELEQAVGLFARAGIAPGSSEAERIWG